MNNCSKIIFYADYTTDVFLDVCAPGLCGQHWMEEFTSDSHTFKALLGFVYFPLLALWIDFINAASAGYVLLA